MFRAVCAVVVVGLSLAACASLGSREALVPDRPDFTDGDLLIAPGVVQMEGGSTVTRTGPLRTIAHGELMMRTGVTPRAEVRVAANSYVTERTPTSRFAGVEDAALGVKIRVQDQPATGSWKPAVAVLLNSTVPTGARHYRARRAQPEFKLITAWTLTERLSLSSNVNVGRPFDGTRSYLQYAGSGSLGYAPTERVGLYTELYAIAPRDGSRVVHRVADSGVFLLLSPDMQLDLRGGLALQTGGHDFFAGVGLAVRR